MALFSDKHIIDSWLQNAKPWVDTVRNNEIESSVFITNKPIVDAIVKKQPQKVL